MPFLQPAADNDPNRCQSNGLGGNQCKYKATEGSKFCPAHGGNKTIESVTAKNIELYRIAKYRTRLNELNKEDDKVKSLREEIGLLRILTEERFNLIKEPLDLLMHSSAIADLVTRIEKLVVSAQKIEEKLGGLLDKNQVIQLAQEIINIIDNNIDDKSKVEFIANQMLLAVDRVSSVPITE
jgi:hypothetical protein